MLNALPAGMRFLTLDDFEPCVGEQFEVDSEPVPVTLRLDRVVKHPHGPGFLTRAPFTLIWSSDANINMLLGTYTLRIRLSRGAAWGPHQVYVEPTLQIDARRRYQSVFY
jgi:hypothetical protein